MRRTKVDFYANFPVPLVGDAGVWAQAREAAGWHGVCASDHYWVGPNAYPHPFVLTMAMAAATTRIKLTTSFANNLFRSPVEFAQAALTLHHQSGGRFEAGLGAGWLEDEMIRTGQAYPDAPTRVTMYREAMTIVRQLLKDGTCAFQGEHYKVDIKDPPLACVTETPPLLIGAAGGPRSIREITPLVDCLEVKANSRSTRGGALNLEIYADISEREVREAVDHVRAVRDDIPISVFVMIAVGNEAETAPLKSMLGNGFFSRFVGPAETAAQSLLDLEALGFSRIQVTAFAPGSIEAVENHLGFR